jgi:uncharacterized protein (DUF2252 family)
METMLDRILDRTREKTERIELVDAQTSREQGKKLRKKAARSQQGAWEPAADRPDPVALLASQNETRIPELLPLRSQRMAESAFAFYRGSALIMASDLANTPRTGLTVQCCGDAHVSNFGFFKTPEQHMTFDINDFDETLPGPWEWDVKRLAASIEICGRDCGMALGDREHAVLGTVASYREAMAQFAQTGAMKVWYAHIDADSLYQKTSSQMPRAQKKVAEKTLNKARRKDSDRAVTKLTENIDGELRFISQPPLVVPLRDLVAQRKNSPFPAPTDEELHVLFDVALAGYRHSLSNDKQWLIDRYRATDIARKVVGVGSVGTRAWVIVLQGEDPDDHLMLQIKQAQESVLERFVGKSVYPKHSQRVVEGQRAMQSSSDILLGWTPSVPQGFRKQPVDYYVRQLWNGKGSVDLSIIQPKGLEMLGRACGWTLAHAHARTGNRYAIAGYLGNGSAFDQALLEFSQRYADQNQKDYERFLEALDNGELPK